MIGEGGGEGGGVGEGAAFTYTEIAIHLTIVFDDIVKFARNNYFHTFAPPPLTESWLRPCLQEKVRFPGEG